MNKEEFLKAIMELPKVETNNPISTMNGINVDDLMITVDRLNKVPDYNDLLKENKLLKENAENNDKVVDKVNWENMLLKKENKKYKEVIDKAMNLIKKYGKYDGKKCTQGFQMWSADFNKILDILKEVSE
nr:MAG TPA: hypothetical protein [Caudoviricetes sp.]